ncbi:MAG: hypothetical protein JSV19_09805 [Phycisphaerales bacterium]|nr:MAG: hypothetical protein JSV19_09805 [Phycisphaerales bacterium]
MNGLRLIAGIALSACLVSSTAADGPMIRCPGSGWADPISRPYTYADDLGSSRYDDVLMSKGWHFVRESLTFGSDHAWLWKDAGWELTTPQEGSSAQHDTSQESWAVPIGGGYTPVDGPRVSTQVGDLDLDGDVDLDDYVVFAACMAGPEGGLMTGCAVADLENDGDVDVRDFQTLQGAFGAVLSPHVATYSNSGCLPGTDGSPLRDFYPCPGDDEIELTVQPNTLHVVHRNATYNCCASDIVISLSVQGNLLTLTEEEILVVGCFCVCCYDVEATVVNLAPGTYTVEFCWEDFQTGGQRCHVQDVVIP